MVLPRLRSPLSINHMFCISSFYLDTSILTVMIVAPKCSGVARATYVTDLIRKVIISWWQRLDKPTGTHLHAGETMLQSWSPHLSGPRLRQFHQNFSKLSGGTCELTVSKWRAGKRWKQPPSLNKTKELTRPDFKTLYKVTGIKRFLDSVL